MTHSFTYCVSKLIITYSSFFFNLALGVSLFYLKKSHTSSHKQIVAALKKCRTQHLETKNMIAIVSWITQQKHVCMRIQTIRFVRKKKTTEKW